MTITVLPRLLLKHRVYLREQVNGGFDPEISFDCQAEDMLHAMEQARDAYPGCFLNWVSSHRVVEDLPGSDSSLDHRKKH